MDAIPQLLASTILLGGIYALIAVGLTLIFGVMRVVNFAHGEFLMLGMYLAFWAFTLLGLDPYVTLVLGLPVIFAGGWLSYHLVMRPVIHASHNVQVFTTVGLSGADMGAAWLLPKIVGAGRAMELLLLGDKIPAGDCLRIGLANRVVEPDAALDEAMAIARRLAHGPGLALGMTKKMIWHEFPMDLEAAIEQEAQAQALLLRAHDHREFYNAWMEQREPRFLGR